MNIDARQTELTDVLKRLRSLFPSFCSDEATLDVITDNKKDAKQVKAFASMSGFKTALYNEDCHYRVSIFGSSCGCVK